MSTTPVKFKTAKVADLTAQATSIENGSLLTANDCGQMYYDVNDNRFPVGVEYVQDTRSAASAALTGTLKSSTIYDGMHIIFWLAYEVTGAATLALQTNTGTTPTAVPVYYAGTTRLSYQYASGCPVPLVYRSSVTINGTSVGPGWWCCYGSLPGSTSIRINEGSLSLTHL